MAAAELKLKIDHSIQAFSKGSLTANALHLFQTLGYNTERQAPLDKPTYTELKENYIQPSSPFNETKALVGEWKYIDLLFQLSKEEVLKQTSLFTTKQVDRTAIETYLFFTIELSGDHYSRTGLANITREVNRLFAMPVMILFKHGNLLTLSVISRRLHKRDDSKDVLEKVTLIKDIQIQNPHRAHIEILFDISFDELKDKYSFTNFVELHNAWQKNLDTKELNKRFYRELANWYFWAVQNVEFPDDAEKNTDVRNATSVIRLLTRLIFIWFIKEKGLVQDDLFNRTKLKHILNYKDNNQSTYYKAILQNLFFATLNTEMNKDKSSSRKFRGKSKTNGRDQHYMIHNVFRYEDYFTNPDEILVKYFENVPFLNGGLFECLDRKIIVNGEDKVIRIDGFSEHPKNVLKVPDHLFFSQEQTIDLNEVYGTKNKTYKVKGLIDILDSYKFTVDENTPIEEEVALDPELLGKVFENLLASYNPETQTTARKQTGSFYTPREIVNYMVDKSLMAYLHNKLLSPLAGEVSTNIPSPVKGEGKGGGEQRFRHLLSYTDELHQFTHNEVDTLINAIDNIKILDPACGSGAFPMGILHKLVYILGKLDPNNEKWKQRQINKVLEVPDVTVREKLLEDIEQSFRNNELDYGRKLYLIENSIFGVDIQPIAVQIAKLRFFISLIVDQRINPKKENFGIRPLPNLETKFVAANTLIGIEKPQQLLLRNPEIDIKEEDLKKVRERHFTARTPQTKEKYRKEDERLRAHIAELLKDDGFPSETTEKLAHLNPYDQNAYAEFFDPEWMFGIRDGFDIVIGNPPYVDSETMTRINPLFRDLLRVLYKSAKGNWDLFVIFIEKGLLLTRENGSFSYIVPNKLFGAKYTEALREILLKKQFIEIRDYSDLNVFKEADVYPIVFVIHNERPSSDVIVTQMSDLSTCKNINKINKDIFYKDIYWDHYFGVTSYVNLILKVSNNDKLSKYFSNIVGAATVNEAYQIKKIIRELDGTIKGYKKFINTGTIDKYCSFWGNKKTQYIKTSYYKPVVLSSDLNHINPLRLEQANSNKIIIAGMAKGIEALYDKGEYLAGKSTSIILGDPEKLKVLTAILNSKLISFWFANFYNSLAMAGGYFNIGNNELNNIPIVNLSLATNIGLDKLVTQIQSFKQKDPTADTSILEQEIDNLVYKLYNLTPEEIAIVEGKG